MTALKVSTLYQGGVESKSIVNPNFKPKLEKPIKQKDTSVYIQPNQPLLISGSAGKYTPAACSFFDGDVLKSLIYTQLLFLHNNAMIKQAGGKAEFTSYPQLHKFHFPYCSSSTLILKIDELILQGVVLKSNAGRFNQYKVIELQGAHQATDILLPNLRFIRTSPILLEKAGVKEGILLQFLHYLSYNHKSGISLSFNDLQKVLFPCSSRRTTLRVVESLSSKKLIEIKSRRDSKVPLENTYKLNYTGLGTLLSLPTNLITKEKTVSKKKVAA